MANIEYIWKDKKRYFGMPISFTRYAMSEDRLFTSVGFLNIKDDEVLLYRVRDIDLPGAFGSGCSVWAPSRWSPLTRPCPRWC